MKFPVPCAHAAMGLISIFLFASIAYSSVVSAAPPFVSIESMSDTLLCGELANGTSTCLDAHSRTVEIPKPLGPVANAQYLVANDLGLCSFGANGIACWRKKETAPDLVN